MGIIRYPSAHPIIKNTSVSETSLRIPCPSSIDEPESGAKKDLAVAFSNTFVYCKRGSNFVLFRVVFKEAAQWKLAEASDS